MMNYDRARKRIDELERERELFVLSGEDSLHPFVFQKRLEAIDKEIAYWQETLDDWGAAIEEMTAAELREMGVEEGDDEEEGEPFDDTFDWLSRNP